MYHTYMYTLWYMYVVHGGVRVHTVYSSTVHVVYVYMYECTLIYLLFIIIFFAIGIDENSWKGRVSCL